MVCLGSSPKIIADDLEISPRTINSHIARICKKAGVTRSELVIYGLQHPEALARHGVSTAGLHLPQCDCDSPYCRGMRRAA